MNGRCPSTDINRIPDMQSLHQVYGVSNERCKNTLWTTTPVKALQRAIFGCFHVALNYTKLPLWSMYTEGASWGLLPKRILAPTTLPRPLNHPPFDKDAEVALDRLFAATTNKMSNVLYRSGAVFCHKQKTLNLLNQISFPISKSMYYPFLIFHIV